MLLPATLDPRLTGAELSDANERLRRMDLAGVSVTRVTAGSGRGSPATLAPSALACGAIRVARKP